MKFGDTNYSKEEIVAEMGASFLAGHTGIEQVTLANNVGHRPLAGHLAAGVCANSRSNSGMY